MVLPYGPGQNIILPPGIGGSGHLAIKDTFATESFGSPVAEDFSNTLPGAEAHLVLLVRGTQTTVPIRLRLMASH